MNLKGKGDIMPTQESLNRFISLVREIDQVWSIYQRFISKEVISLFRISGKYIIDQDPENNESDLYDIHILVP